MNMIVRWHQKFDQCHDTFLNSHWTSTQFTKDMLTTESIVEVIVYKSSALYMCISRLFCEL